MNLIVDLPTLLQNAQERGLKVQVDKGFVHAGNELVTTRKYSIYGNHGCVRSSQNDAHIVSYLEHQTGLKLEAM